jgi:hypothetical protein
MHNLPAFLEAAHCQYNAHGKSRCLAAVRLIKLLEQ